MRVILFWNGNEIPTQERQKFQTELPDSNHSIESFDVHPILGNLFFFKIN